MSFPTTFSDLNVIFMICFIHFTIISVYEIKEVAHLKFGTLSVQNKPVRYIHVIDSSG